MPELPEMENYRRMLSDQIIDQPITNVVINREKSVNVPADQFKNELAGQRVIFVERRGKHLIFHLNNGRRLLLHLMLGGMLYCGTEEDRPSRSTQVEIGFGQKTLYFIGLRLGYLHLLSAKEVDEILKPLGPELFDRRMSKERFVELLQGRRGALKSLLVNQHAVAGIGNCYADEIAFEAGLLPSAKIQELSEDTLGRLYDAAVKVLTEALEHGGYMESPFMAGDTLTGGFNDLCKVYDREGEKCYRCGGVISKVELTGRKAFFCPSCQHEQ
ncbi:DNA-formamidopyrimidine glycosylase family protein [Paenibacillus sp.]|jgi:formamidopyrimidine-DNA glycosylase|uniref:Fpg/Nei family DNA glycosylase n=1 Tax=Paenibacillus sp. TaxID=58172 RepID=UPI00282C5E8A|nr:DNA-formamidopyrimidine glycosylase family protein [Paenibacillus sp.]MDR0270875.1 endonuclease VIII [Paenibacillus sp.]